MPHTREKEINLTTNNHHQMQAFIYKNGDIFIHSIKYIEGTKKTKMEEITITKEQLKKLCQMIGGK